MNNVSLSFCHICGNLRDYIDLYGDAYTCKSCGIESHVSEKGNLKLIKLDLKNSITVTEILYKKKEEGTQNTDEDLSALPTIDEICPKCGHNELAFTLQQIRSVDEGQTVFYTCLKCKYKFTHNN